MDRNTKKKIIRARNQKIQRTQHHIDQHQDATQAAQAQQQETFAQQVEASREAAQSSTSDEPWTARTQMIRNRITNKKRKSMDRWNRFAGTSGGGGMGR